MSLPLVDLIPDVRDIRPHCSVRGVGPVIGGGRFQLLSALGSTLGVTEVE